MSGRLRIVQLALFALALSGCVSVPTPQYQPAISNTELLLKSAIKLGVGSFTAANGVQNKSLTMRESTLNGGSDGTYSTYLREAAVKELQTASAYQQSGPLVLSGMLTHNELNAGFKTGSAIVGAEFTLKRGEDLLFKKTLEARQEWESSFVGVVAIDAAINNYSGAMQRLLGQLFADPEFIAAAGGHVPK